LCVDRDRIALAIFCHGSGEFHGLGEALKVPSFTLASVGGVHPETPGAGEVNVRLGEGARGQCETDEHGGQSALASIVDHTLDKVGFRKVFRGVNI
jgi:hypothetical protein